MQLTVIDNIAVFKFLHYLIRVMFQTTKKFTDGSIGFTSSLEIPPPCREIREWTETEKNDNVSQVMKYWYSSLTSVEPQILHSVNFTPCEELVQLCHFRRL